MNGNTVLPQSRRLLLSVRSRCVQPSPARTKPRTGVIGGLLLIYATPHTYNGSAEITNNRITVASANSSGIVVHNPA
jgi:hypothetical protein